MTEYLFRKHTAHLPFRELLDGGIVSYEIGAIKPEKEIYRQILNKYSLNASACIFYDDLERNVEAAREQGIESHLIRLEEDLLDKLSKL